MPDWFYSIWRIYGLKITKHYFAQDHYVKSKACDKNKELAGNPTIEYTATTRESLLMGPYGGVKLKTIWDGYRLLTIIVEGGH